ncbi:MAG TPA: SDR family oxidoreductase [Terriglobales bacterium]|nr:SDR family oxidoreductase [Terriglobales bacterium]
MAEKIALVTGSSSGIGLLTAVELARAGFRVVASMRDLGRRARLDEAATTAGVAGQIDVRRLDITEFESIPEFIAQLDRDYLRLDVLVNNAGFAVAGFAEDLLLEELRQQFETNFFGQVAVTRAVLPLMRRQRAGHIILVSSIGGRVSAPVIGAYDASKFALEGWSESLRIETRSLGIRVVLVEPGSFQTDIWERNVRVGSYALDRTSPNHERGARFSEVVKKVRKANPLPVAKLIARIAQTPNPRLRYRVGFDAHLQFWLHALLPWKVYEKLAIRATKIG